MAEATTAIEILESRNRFTVNGSRIRQRTWKVYSNDGSTLTDSNAVGNSAIPRYGDPYVTPEESDPLLKVYRHMADPVPGFRDHYIVTVLYRISIAYATDKGQDTIGYVEPSATTQATFMEWWRQPLFGGGGGFDYIPSMGNAPNFGTDIGGTPIDVAGVPTSYLRVQKLFRLYEVTGSLINFTLTLLQGTRNETPFLGSAPGTLLYKGSVDRSILNGSLVARIHEFSWDVYFHLVQVIDRDTNAHPILMPGPNEYKVAKTVTWRQPFAQVTEFRDLSPYIAEFVGIG